MKKRPLIGVIAPILSRNHVQNIMRGAAAQAQACECDMLVLAPLIHFTYCTREHSLAEEKLFELLSSADFDGFLYIRDDVTMGAELVGRIEQRLLQSNTYVMTVDEQEHPVFDSTQYDDYDDFCKIVRHLIDVHHYQKIYCLTGPEHSFQAQTRLRAYRDTLTEHGLFYDESYYTYGTFWVDSAIAFAGRLISGELSMPEAVVCGNDVTAMALIRTLQAAGIRVPEDVAVTGYDGYPFAANINITLTTYARNHYQLGADAMRRLYRNITGTLRSKVHRPHSGMLIGHSCGCTSIPAKQLLSDTAFSVPRMLEEDVFCDDITPDLALACSVQDLLLRALRHSRMLYQMQTLGIYLYEPDGSLRPAAERIGDAIPQLLDAKPLPLDHAAGFLRHSQDPELIYLSPLHLNAHQFGMLALSFTEPERVYDRSYLHFVSNLELMLDRFRYAPAVIAPERTELRQTLDDLRETLREAPEQPWTIEMLCERSGIRKSTLQKYYKQFYGRSIFEDLIGFRIELAKRLLTETELSISEITERCGYSTESYFMKQFKKLTGTTPTLYRKGK